jgi:succinate-acetate transporter protein
MTDDLGRRGLTDTTADPAPLALMAFGLTTKPPKETEVAAASG